MHKSIKGSIAAAGAGAAALGFAFVGIGTASAMGGTLPNSVTFNTAPTAIIAHIGQGNGVTNCRINAQMGARTPLTTPYTNNPTITLGRLAPGTYNAAVQCKDHMNGPNPVVINSQTVTVGNPAVPMNFVQMILQALGSS